MSLNFFNAGHRGLGCTDHIFYSDKRDIRNLPVENTEESVNAAYDAGQAYFETDACESLDGVIYTIHNVKPEDHFFGAVKPAKMLNQLPFAEIKKFKTGRFEKGKVTRMSEMLTLAKKRDPHQTPFAINIEIKGNQGSGQNYETSPFLANLADVVKASGIDISRVLFSSFSLENIIHMSHLLPGAQFGMLYAENTRDGSAPKPRAIYADHQDDKHYQYLPFDIAHIDYVAKEWTFHAHEQTALAYAHPEIQSITPGMIRHAGKRAMGINCWALFEECTETRRALYAETIRRANEEDVAFTVITDYLAEMQRLKPVA